MYRTKSLRIDVTLKPDALGRRVITLEPVFGDVVYVDTARSTVSNYSNIWVGVDDEVMVNAAYSPVLDVRPAFFRKINIAWNQAEDNKVLSLIVGREASLRLQPPQYMALAQDLIGLAKDATVSNIANLTFDSAKNLKIDVANAEVMIPTNLQARYKSSMTLYSGTVTANGNSSDIDVSTISALEIELKVSAVSGTSPTLSVYIEGKFEATGDYKPLVYQEGITTTGIWWLTITQLAFRYIRVRWVVSGTSPSFTITVAGQAMV